MKKILSGYIFLLCFGAVTIMVSCKDEPSAEPDPLQELMVFNIGNNYYSPLPGDTLDVHYYLIDRNGNLIADTAAVNGQIIRMYAEFDPNETYDLTIVSKTTANNHTDYSVLTCLDVKPTTIKLTKPDTNSLAEAVFIITGVDQNLVDLTPNFSNFDYSAIDQRASINVPLQYDPDVVYGSFRKEGDTLRYIYRNQVYGNTTDTFIYQTLPVIDSTITVLFPQNSNLTSSLYGLLDPYPGRLFFIDSDTNSLGSTVGTYAFPDSIFDRYKFYSGMYIDGHDFSIEKIVDSIPLQVDTPALAFNVVKSNPADFQISSPSSFDLFRALFTAQSDEKGYTLTWTVIGRGNQNVHFTIPFLPEMFAQEHNITLQDLVFAENTIYQYEGLDLYLKQVQHQISHFAIPEDQITSLESLRHE
jgi:hypothetical protein